MVTIVLPNDLLAVQLPQAGIVIRAGRDEVRAIGAEGAVPDPALVAGQRRLERERPQLLCWLLLRLLLGLRLAGSRRRVLAVAGAVSPVGLLLPALGGQRRLLLLVRAFEVHLPDLGRVVGAAGGKLLHVGGQQDARDDFLVGGEVRDGEELGAVEGLQELPDEDVTLVAAQERRVR